MTHANDNTPQIPLRFLSVCSGIEAASVAWHPLGWRAVAFSEIEKFPSAVLAHHYPDVPNLGDFTAIDTTKLGQVDILAGGTPCQAFSVAGLRQGLDDARGNLTLKFVELAHELADGNGLRNVVWENVVGVLSDKGNAFGCFLAGLVGADSAVVPGEKPAAWQSNKQWRWSRADGFHIPIWPRHGMVAGPKGRAAWAVKDAQFFGVAQRRRRVLVVADFGNGADPAAVLFEPEGVFRHPPARGEAGKDVAPTISARTKGGGGLGTDFDLDGGLRVDSAYAIQERAVSLNLDAGPQGKGYQPDIAYTLEARNKVQSVAYAPEIARCVATREGSSQDYESTTMVAVAGTLCKDSFSGGMGGRPEGAAAGHVVAVSTLDGHDVARTLSARHDGSPCADRGPNIVAQTVAIRGRDGGATAELGGEVATALRASQGGGDKPHVLAFGIARDALDRSGEGAGGSAGERSGLGILEEMSQTLKAKAPNAVATTSAVRRLTPMECERLQGFPDSYTAIPWRGKPADQCPDGPRYKALGNSWAVPKFVWLGKRIAQFMPPVAEQQSTKQKPAAANDNDGVSDEVAA